MLRLYKKIFRKYHLSCFSGAFNDDIYKVTDVSIIPDFDILCAGFPCQKYSQPKKWVDNLDGRGNIFFEIENIEIEKLEHLF